MSVLVLFLPVPLVYGLVYFLSSSTASTTLSHQSSPSNESCSLEVYSHVSMNGDSINNDDNSKQRRNNSSFSPTIILSTPSLLARHFLCLSCSLAIPSFEALLLSTPTSASSSSSSSSSVVITVSHLPLLLSPLLLPPLLFTSTAGRSFPLNTLLVLLSLPPTIFLCVYPPTALITHCGAVLVALLASTTLVYYPYISFYPSYLQSQRIDASIVSTVIASKQSELRKLPSNSPVARDIKSTITELNLLHGLLQTRQNSIPRWHLTRTIPGVTSALMLVSRLIMSVRQIVAPSTEMPAPLIDVVLSVLGSDYQANPNVQHAISNILTLSLTLSSLNAIFQLGRRLQRYIAIAVPLPSSFFTALLGVALVPYLHTLRVQIMSSTGACEPPPQYPLVFVGGVGVVAIVCGGIGAGIGRDLSQTRSKKEDCDDGGKKGWDSDVWA